MPWWGQLLSALAAGGFALGGVALGQHFTRQQKHDDRLDALRREQRDVLVELVDAVEHWAPQAEIASLFLGKASSNDRDEWVDTDSGRQLRDSVRELRRVLVKCRLVVVDSELRPLVLQVAAALRRQPDEVNGPIVEAADQGRDTFEAVLNSVRYYRDVQRLVEEMEEVAVRRLAAPAPAGPRARLRGRRRRRTTGGNAST